MLPLTKQRLAAPYMLAVIAAGAAALAYSLVEAPSGALTGKCLLLLFLTALVSGRGVIAIPGTKGHISVADTFVFLAMLLFGVGAAVLTASFEALYCSLRCTSKVRTALFNTAAIGLSTFATGMALTALFGPPTGLGTAHPGGLLSAACVMAVVQYTLNSWLVAAGSALRAGLPLFATWRTGFLWTSLTYIGGAGAAVLAAKAATEFGFYATLAVWPVIAIIYFTYVTYLRNVEISAAQAVQARRHAEELRRHIDEQERIARRLRESEGQFRGAFDNAPVGMALLSPRGDVLKVNGSLCRLLEKGEAELTNAELLTCVHPEDAPTVAAVFERLHGGFERADAEVRLLDAGGEPVWTAVSTSLVRGDGGEPLHLIAQVQDIRERMRAEEALRGLSMVDELTGLYNRRGFLTFAEQHLSVARRDGKRMMVFYADLDGMKQINDTYGHKEGDRALVEVARLFRKSFRESDVLARLGGDEFTVLASGASEKDAEVIVSRLRRKVEAANGKAGRTYTLSVSVGVAYFGPDSDLPVEELLVRADEAMYENKRRKRQRVTPAPVAAGEAGPAVTPAGEPDPCPEVTTAEVARPQPETGFDLTRVALPQPPERETFADALGTAAEAAQGTNGGEFAVMFAEVEKFGEVNARLGHSAGDLLLVLVEARLRGCLRQGDVLACCGGGRFVGLLNSTRDETDVARVSGRFKDALAYPFSVGGDEVTVTLAAGAVMSAGKGETPDDLLRRAEAAMYSTKGGARVGTGVCPVSSALEGGNGGTDPCTLATESFVM